MFLLVGPVFDALNELAFCLLAPVGPQDVHCTCQKLSCAFSRSCSSIKSGKSCCRMLKPEQTDCCEKAYLALHIYLTPHGLEVLETLTSCH